MRIGRRFARPQRITIVNGILAIVLILVILQLWLLVATMNSYLGGQVRILLPAAAVSAVCFFLVVGLLWYLHGLDH